MILQIAKLPTALLTSTACLTAWGSPTPFDPLGESMPQFTPLVSVAARWVLGAYLANHAVAIGTGSPLGADMLTNGLVSTTHVVFWTPAAYIYLFTSPAV